MKKVAVVLLIIVVLSGLSLAASPLTSPRNFEIRANGPNSILLTWKYTGSNSIDGFVIKEAGRVVASVNKDVRSYVINNAKECGAYSYQIQSYKNRAFSDPVLSLCVPSLYADCLTTNSVGIKPVSPSVVIASNRYCRKVVVKWTATDLPLSVGRTFDVRRSLGVGGTYFNVVNPSPLNTFARNFVDTETSQGTTYGYAVSAKCLGYDVPSGAVAGLTKLDECSEGSPNVCIDSTSYKKCEFDSETTCYKSNVINCGIGEICSGGACICEPERDAGIASLDYNVGGPVSIDLASILFIAPAPSPLTEKKCFIDFRIPFTENRIQLFCKVVSLSPTGYYTVYGLPDGLSLNSLTGIIMGTPTGTGSFAFDAEYSNGLCLIAKGEIILNPIRYCPQIIIYPNDAPLSAGTVGAAYSQTLSASGGVSPYTYSVSSGALPSGLTLSNNGEITGNPTTAGTYDFTINLIDANGCYGTQNYEIVVYPAGASCPSDCSGFPFELPVNLDADCGYFRGEHKLFTMDKMDGSACSWWAASVGENGLGDASLGCGNGKWHLQLTNMGYGENPYELWAEKIGSSPSGAYTITQLPTASQELPCDVTEITV